MSPATVLDSIMWLTGAAGFAVAIGQLWELRRRRIAPSIDDRLDARLAKVTTALSDRVAVHQGAAEASEKAAILLAALERVVKGSHIVAEGSELHVKFEKTAKVDAAQVKKTLSRFH